MDAKTVVETLNKLARLDSGLSEEDREALWAAYCFCFAHWTLLEASIVQVNTN